MRKTDFSNKAVVLLRNLIISIELAEKVKHQL
jgi:hypothetical protein